MQFTEAQKGECIYEEGDHAYYFFIIAEGSVSYIIDDKIKKTLKRGDFFGDTSLVYNSPRSNSIICNEDCKFWALHRKIFSDTLRKIKLIHFKENRKFIRHVRFFDNLGSTQIAALAMEMVTEKFMPQMNIVEEGNPANSFYIIKSGKVSVVKNGTIVAFLDSHSYFGESALSKSTTKMRSATVRAETEVECLAIGKSAFFCIFGDDVSNLVKRNILRSMLRDNSQFKNLPNVTHQKFINKMKRIEFNEDAKILEIGKNYHKIFFVIGYHSWEKSHFEKESMIIYGPEDVEGKEPLITEDNLISRDKKCIVYELELQDLYSCLEGHSIQDAIEKNKRINEIFGRVNLIKKRDSLAEFRYVKNIGIGGYGTVVLCLDKDDNYRAIKIVPRESITSRSAIRMLKHEKEVLEMVKFSFIARLRSTYRDENNFYLIMDFINGVGFEKVLIDLDILTDDQIRFYLASTIIMLKYLHERSIIFRDLKPENILCDNTGYLNLIDFGAAKALGSDNNKAPMQESVEDTLERTFTMVGTPHYMAPEVLRQGGYSYSADFWSLGILAFEILCGYVPFGEEQSDVYKIYEIIQSEELEFPIDVENEDIMGLIKKLLSKAPESRVKGGEIGELMAEKFFDGFDWASLITREMKPPYTPEIKPVVVPDGNVSFEGKIREETLFFLKGKNAQLFKRPDLDISELDKYF